MDFANPNLYHSSIAFHVPSISKGSKSSLEKKLDFQDHVSTPLANESDKDPHTPSPAF